jgi:hypothetical protein
MKNIFLISIILIATKAKAQDTLRITKFTLGGVYNTGNVNSFQLSTKSLINYDGAKSKHGIILSPDYFIQYAQTSDGEMIKKAEDLRADLFFWRDIKKGFSLIAFSDLEHSYSKRIDLRVAGGIGIKKEINGNGFRANISLAPVYDDMLINGDWENSFRASVRQSISREVLGVLISNVVLYQPAFWSKSGFTGSNNKNLSNNLDITKKISKTISLGISYESWTSTLPTKFKDGLKATDQRVSFTLTYKR